MTFNRATIELTASRRNTKHYMISIPSTHGHVHSRSRQLILFSLGLMTALNQTRTYVIVALLFAVSGPLAHADGLDSAYFVRFGRLDHSWTYFGTVLSLIMIANYLLNFAVIGLPAICWASVHPKTVALGLVVLTILGQIADRIGAIVGLFVALPIAAIASPFFPPHVAGSVAYLDTLLSLGI